MNCHELKTIMIEHADLESLAQDASVSTHLEQCSSCRAALKFEVRLRAGFVKMTEEALPADIARQIMAIQKNEMTSPWFTRLIESIRNGIVSPQFRIAVFASLTGFFLGIFMMRSHDDIPSGKSLQKHREVLVEASSEPVFAAPATPATPAASERIRKKDIQIASSRVMQESTDSVKAVDREMSAGSEDMIPGAVSFSLAEDAAMMQKDKDNDAAPATEERPQLAMAPAMARGNAIKPTASRMKMDSMKKSSFAVPEKELFDAAPEDTFAEQPSEQSSEQPAEIDGRGKELELLLLQHDIRVSQGFLNLEQLAVKGYLSMSQLKRLKPQTGCAWFVEIKNDEMTIFQKKR